MTRWFRFYDDVINDPKVLSLPEAMRWSWVAILCAASKNDGKLPAIDHLGLMLRVTKQRGAAIIATLHAAGLIDKTETGFAPHNWDGRQYKSDVSNERVKRYRDKHRNVTAAVTVTPPETDTESDAEQKHTEAKASGADAPRDARSELFNRGLETLARLTGKGPDACRSFVGKCLKAASDDAITVLGLIEDAERNRVVDPSAWIVARLKPSTGPPARASTVHQQRQAEGREILDDIGKFISGDRGEADSRVLRHDPGDGPESLRGGAGGNLITLSASRAGTGG